MSHKNYNSLRKAILDKAKESMKEDVLPYVQLEMTKAIDSTVYSVYSPHRYDRRKWDDGLLSMKNIEGQVVRRVDPNGFDFIVRNTTKTNFGGRPRVYLTPLVVLGQIDAMEAGYGWEYLYYQYSEIYRYGQPRDFITETKERLDKDRMVSLLRYGLRSMR